MDILVLGLGCVKEIDVNLSGLFACVLLELKMNCGNAWRWDGTARLLVLRHCRGFKF